jgi:hypothetical protein
MIQLKVGDEYLELPPDLTINLKLNNPLFNEDNLSPGSYSLPFTLPVANKSQTNHRILNYTDVIETLNTFKKVDAQLLFKDIPLKRGQLVADTLTNQTINANLKFGLTTLDEGIKTKKLRDVIDDEVVVGTSPCAKTVYVKHFRIDVFGDPMYRINVNGRDYEDEHLDDLVDQINADTTEPRVTATYYDAGTTPGGMAAPYIKIVPHATADPTNPYTPFSIKNPEVNYTGGNNEGWNAEAYGLEDYWQDFDDWIADFQSETPSDQRFRFPTFFNDSALEPDSRRMYLGRVTTRPYYFPTGTSWISPTSEKITNYVNAFNANGLIKNRILGRGLSVYNWNSLVPCLRLEWVLTKIAEYLDVTLKGDFIDIISNILIYNPNGIDLWMPFLGDKRYLFWKREFNCNELIPDVSVRDFLIALCSRYNVGCYYLEQTRELVFSKKEPIAKAYAYNDITDQAGRINPIKDETVDGLSFKTEIDETDAYAQADDLTIGNGELEIKIKASALSKEFTHSAVVNAPENGYTSPPYGYVAAQMKGPVVNQPPTENYKIRFFHYTGITDNGVFEYPSASINHPDWDETMDGENGIYKTFHEYWALYTAGRKVVNSPIQFTLAQLKNFNWELKQRLDRKDYLVKSIDLSISHAGITVENVELYTMRL